MADTTPASGDDLISAVASMLPAASAAPAAAPSTSRAAAPTASPAAAPADDLIGAITQMLPAAPAAGSSLFDATIAQESGGKQFATDGTPLTSKKGAIGIAQVMPKTAPEAAQLAGLPYDDLRYRTDAEYNKALGRAYLAKQLADFGDPAQALAAYNAGPQATRQAIDRAQREGNPQGWLNHLPPETRAYVPAILKHGSQVDAAAAASPRLTTYQPEQPRSWKDASWDTLLGAGSGLAGLVKSGGELYGLASGDMNNVASRVGDAVQNYLQDSQSDSLKGKRAARDADVASQDGWVHKAWTAFADTVSDPALAADVFSSNLATMIPGAMVGRAAATYTGGRAMLAAMEAGPVSLAARQAIAKSAAEVGVWSAKGAMAVQQGADVAQQAYDDALKKPQAVWDQNPEYQRLKTQVGDAQAKHQLALSAARATFTPAAAISVAANSLPGGDAVERMLVGGAATKGGLTGGLLARTAKAAGGETLQEALEEGGGQFAGNVANQQYVDPNQDLTYQVGENAGIGAAGGFVQGAAAGPFHRGGHPEIAPVQDAAAQPDSPLARAAVAGNTGPLADAQRTQAAQAAQQTAQTQAAAQADPIAERSQQIALSLRAPGVLDQLRAKDSPVKVDKLLHDLAIAQSPSTAAATREQAIGRLEYALEWAGVNTRTTETDRANAAAQAGASAHDTAPAAQQAAVQAQQQDAMNQQVASQPAPAPHPDDVIAALQTAAPLRTAEQTQFVRQAQTRYTPEQFKLFELAAHYAAGMSATQKIQLQQLRNEAAPSAAPTSTDVAPAEETSTAPAQTSAIASPDAQASASASTPAATPREQVAAPKTAVPPVAPGRRDLGAGRRKRRATLDQLVAMGLNQVERRGNQHVLTDGSRREFALEGAADAQLARQAIQAHIDAKTGAATGHLASNAQVEADNYKKGEPVTLHPGVTFIAEHGKGTERFDRKHTPPRWRQVLKHAYGDIEGTIGADGDKVDAFIVGNGNKIFVIDQVDPKTGKFDEHKVMLRARDEQSARDAYLANYEPGWQGLSAITEMTPEQFRAWVHDKTATSKPVAQLQGKKADERNAGHADDPSTGRSDGAGRAEPAGSVGDRGVRDGAHDAGAADDATAGQSGAGRQAAASDVDLRAGSDVRISFTKDGKPVITRVKVVSVGEMPAGAAFEQARGMAASLVRGAKGTQVSESGRQLLQAVAAIFGKRVAFFEGDRSVGDGFVHPDFPGTIFLTAGKSSINPMAVLGHELFHRLRREQPLAWRAVADVIAGRVAQPDAFRRDYEGNAKIDTGNTPLSKEPGGELEELTSDLAGNLFTDPKFWDEVYAKIQQDNPAEARSLIAKLVAFIRPILDAAIAAVRGPKFNADGFVSDLEKIREAMSTAVAAYAKGAGITRAAIGADVQRETVQQSKARDVTRRDFLMAAAATLAAGDARSEVKLGRATPIDEKVWNQPLDAQVAKILRGNGATNPAGAKALKESLGVIARSGPAATRALAAEIAKLLPDAGIALAVEKGDWNAHGALELSPIVRMRLFDGKVSHGLRYSTLLHESLHAAVAARYQALSTSMARSNDAKLGMSAPKAAAALEQFHGVWREFGAAAKPELAKLPEDSDMRLSLEEAVHSPDEFFVRALTDANLQGWMATKEYQGQTLLKRFVDWVKTSLLGLRSEGTRASWLDAALLASDDLAKSMTGDAPDFKRLTAIANFEVRRSPQRSEEASARSPFGIEQVEAAPKAGETSDNPQHADRTRGKPAAAGSADGVAPDAGPPPYGTPRDSAVSAVGIHYSHSARKSLDANAYGRGAKGLERERLAGRVNDDIRPRTFFYVDQGRGVKPEVGVGGQAHAVQLNNLYDVVADPLGLVKENPGANHWERAVLRAGFDGYLRRDPQGAQGYAVLLGKRHSQVPVQSIAAPGMKSADVSPASTSRALMSKELDQLDTSAIPGAKLRAGTLTVPAGSEEFANQEMARIGAQVRFRTRADEGLDEAEGTISRRSLQDVAKAIEAKLPGVRLEVHDNPEQAGLEGPPGGESPMGVTLADGRVLLFRDGIASRLEAERTAFHELFHRGLRALPQAEYHAKMDALFEASPEVERLAIAWGRGTEAKARQQAGMSNRQLRSLAIEEALAQIAEDVGGQDDTQVAGLAHWLADVADTLGLEKVAQWLRGATPDQARQFIRETLARAADPVAGESNTGANRLTDVHREAGDLRKKIAVLEKLHACLG